MTNEITTSSAQLTRREGTKEKLRQGFILVKEALQELAEDGCTSTEAFEICNEVREGIVGKSTVQRHYKAFKDLGIYIPPEPSNNPEAERSRKRRANRSKPQNEATTAVENSTPIPPTTESNNDSQVPATPTPKQHCVQDDGETTTLVTTAMPNENRQQSQDAYNQICQLIEATLNITSKATLSNEQWRSVYGHSRALCDYANIQRHNKSRS